MGKDLTRPQKQKIWARDRYTCFYCGTKVIEWTGLEKDMGNVATVDHIEPRNDGGGNEESNRITACFHCNCQKGIGNLEDYRWCQAQRSEAGKMRHAVEKFATQHGLPLDRTLQE